MCAQAERHKADLEAEQLVGLTLHPEITEMAHSLPRGRASTLQHLTTARTHHTQERLNTLKGDKEREELAECTFRPVINNATASRRPMSAQVWEAAGWNS